MSDQIKPVLGANNVVRVKIPVAAAYNIEKLQDIQKIVLGRLGCLACCSGFDIRFEQEMDFTFDENGKLRSGI